MTEATLLPPGVFFETVDPPRAFDVVQSDILGIVGFAERGPLHTPVRVESWSQYVTVFGGFGVPGFLPYGVRLFFENGGRAAYVVRVAVASDDNDNDIEIARRSSVASAALELTGGAIPTLKVHATSPGRWGNGVRVSTAPEAGGRFTILVTEAAGGGAWRLPDCTFLPGDERFLPDVLARSPGIPIGFHPGDMAAVAASAPVTVPLRDVVLDGGRDGVGAVKLRHILGNEAQPLGLRALEDVDPVALVAVPDGCAFPWSEPRYEPFEAPLNCRDPRAPDPERPGADLVMGSGGVPVPGDESPVEAPPRWSEAETTEVAKAMIAMCERRRDCTAIIDAPDAAQRPEQIADYAGRFASSFAGLYWPWLVVERNPGDARRGTLALPPSAVVAGLTANADVREGPHRSPAGQTGLGVLRTTWLVTDGEHGRANRLGVNVFRERPSRGVKLEGARSLSKGGRLDVWRFLNVRRVMHVIQESLEQDAWPVVFEGNTRALRSDFQDRIYAFLAGLWSRGWLLGAQPEHSFYVRCDDVTNPPDSVDSGRLIAWVGLRFPPPIEWVVVRIGQSRQGLEILTADRA